MTDTEKINAIKHLLKKYDFQFDELTISQAMEEMSLMSFYDIAEEVSDFLNFGSKLIEIVYEE